MSTQAVGYDATKIRHAPIPSTLALLNNFLTTTSQFLNGFAENIDKKLCAVSSKINDLEILLAIVESKLNSIPGLEDAVTTTNTTIPATTANENNNIDSNNSNSATSNINNNATSAAASQVIESAPSSATATGGTKASEHPDYAPFFKMLRVGVPGPVVMNKLQAAGLDPSVVDNPDKIIGSDGAAIPASSQPSNAPVAQATIPTVSDSVQNTPAPTGSSTNDSGTKASEHPDYAPFFKMLRVGVPGPVVMNKLQAAGLDPSVVDNPDKFV